MVCPTCETETKSVGTYDAGIGCPICKGKSVSTNEGVVLEKIINGIGENYLTKKFVTV